MNPGEPPAGAANPNDPTLAAAAGRNAWRPPSLAQLQQLLPQYTFLEMLGEGGMGAVYKARQTSLDRLVAIKILPPDLDDGSEDDFAERFRQEARTMAKLNHPCIVHVHDFGQMSDGQFYFVMEYVEGTDVEKMIRAHKRLKPDDALAITAHVCDALEYAHAHGIIHRDIKPSNVLINRDGDVKIADFGLAKAADPQGVQLTRSNISMGTPQFMAPETMDPDVQVDGRADVYAVGVTLHNMLTGEIPRGVFKLPSKKVGCDARFDRIVAKAMEADREQRYQSAGAIRRDLDTIMTTPMAKAKSDAPSPEGARPLGLKKIAALTAVAALAVLAAAVFVGLRPAKQAASSRSLPASVPTMAPPPGGASTAAPRASPVVRPSPATPIPAPVPRQTLDLLALVDPVKDRVPAVSTGANRWEKSGAGLRYVTDGKAGKIAAPVALRARSYDMEIVYRSLSGARQFNVDLPLANGKSFPFAGDPPQPAATSPTSRLILRVRVGPPGVNDRVTVTRDAQPIANWEGHLQQQGQPYREHPEFPGAPIVTLYSFGGGYEFTEWTLRVFEGEATPLRARAGAEPAPAAAEYAWSAPENLGPAVNSDNNELYVSLTDDALCLVYLSVRDGRYELLESNRNRATDPFGLPEPIKSCNTKTPGQKGAPCLSGDGLSLRYFAAEGPGHQGGHDLYVSRRGSRQSIWGTPANLGPPLNTPAQELSPSLSPDGLALLFASDRPGSQGVDLWRSRRKTDKEPFAAPENLGPSVNTADSEHTPRMTPDGRALLFVRAAARGPARLFRAAARADGGFEPAQPLDLSVAGNVQSPVLSPDGQTLYFTSDCAGGLGGYDIWKVRRVPKARSGP